ncbi:MAG: Trp biosynthesis-associated membrane protein [Microbacteriaceae bacterium]
MAAVGSGPRGGRVKLITLLAGAAVNGLTMMTWTGQWFTLQLVGSQTGRPELSVGGSVAAPALAALSLAGLALVAALALAGPVFRIILGGLQALIGVCVLLSAGLAIADPIGASAPVITKATGVAGSGSMARLVQAAGQSAWPWLALILGAGSVTLGIMIVLTARRWPASSRRYQAVRFSGETAAGYPSPGGRSSGSAVDDWDDLSQGKDPTG